MLPRVREDNSQRLSGRSTPETQQRPVNVQETYSHNVLHTGLEAVYRSRDIFAWNVLFTAPGYQTNQPLQSAREQEKPRGPVFIIWLITFGLSGDDFVATPPSSRTCGPRLPVHSLVRLMERVPSRARKSNPHPESMLRKGLLPGASPPRRHRQEQSFTSPTPYEYARVATRTEAMTSIRESSLTLI